MESHKIVMELPYLTTDLPGTGGTIKERYEHFIVEEVPLYKPSGTGRHLYISITREGMTTREVQKRLAELFGVGVEKVGCAGMKDKNARSTQTFSVETGEMDPESIEEVMEEAAEGISESLPVRVNWFQMHANKLRTGHLLGNRFTIRITNLDTEPVVAMERAMAVADGIKEKGLPNFYGSQRFGLNGDNARKGLDIILRNCSVDDKWLRRLLISSYQSYLCNRYLARRIEKGMFGRIIEGDIAKKYDTGGLFVVKDAKAEQPRYDRKEISFTAPIFGSKMMQASGPAGRMENDILNDAGMTTEQLSDAGANGTRRTGRVLVSEFEARMVEDGLELRFFLPKGAFATTLLREIMKKNL